jgi:hypothetical protein
MVALFSVYSKEQNFKDSELHNALISIVESAYNGWAQRNHKHTLILSREGGRTQLQPTETISASPKTNLNLEETSKNASFLMNPHYKPKPPFEASLTYAAALRDKTQDR